ncbi:MAG TPA: ferritin [Prolixibacteraceae bacterium]|jgi:ferritin|nr:ferritin [Prolixibacteraceae bacterium]
MIKKEVLAAINEQINAESYSAYMYLSMAAYFEEMGLSGFGHWMKIQYQEESAHALKFFNYLTERNGKVALKAIAQVPVDFNGIVDVFEKTLAHENHVTQLIDHLMDVAVAANDHATQSFMKWFVDEQVEEEANVEKILATLKLINGQGNGIFMMDREMSMRVFVDPNAAV